MPPPTISDLIFSEQANHNFSKTLGELRKHTLSIRNRLQSILEDAAFVQSVSAAYGRPLIANERCGSWYIDPDNKKGSAYFKSTDGHTGAWSFSTRRLNVHLLDAIGKCDGCIIVDSTRRGKRMPDALSKTIPIWCSVLNRALFPGLIDCHELYTPPIAVSSSEHAQIAARLEDFVQSFLSLDIDCAALRAQIAKPLRPMWVTPESYISSEDTIFESYHPIICCTASRRVTGGEVSEGGYIQGSGDDTENWAYGLTPPIFWTNSQLLLSTSEAELPNVISELIARPSPQLSSIPPLHALIPIPPTSTLYITDLNTTSNYSATKYRLLITLHPETTLSPPSSKYHLSLPLGPHKLGSRNLRSALPTITSFICNHISSVDELSSLRDNTAAIDEPVPVAISITIASTPAADHAVGVALAILCQFYDDNGNQQQHQSQQQQPLKRQRSPSSTSSNEVSEAQMDNSTPKGNAAAESQNSELKIDKQFIRRRLGWIVTAIPSANPSGATLQSVNGFLMPRR